MSFLADAADTEIIRQDIRSPRGLSMGPFEANLWPSPLVRLLGLQFVHVPRAFQAPILKSQNTKALVVTLYRGWCCNQRLLLGFTALLQLSYIARCSFPTLKSMRFSLKFAPRTCDCSPKCVQDDSRCAGHAYRNSRASCSLHVAGLCDLL